MVDPGIRKEKHSEAVDDDVPMDVDDDDDMLSVGEISTEDSDSELQDSDDSNEIEIDSIDGSFHSNNEIDSFYSDIPFESESSSDDSDDGLSYGNEDPAQKVEEEGSVLEDTLNNIMNQVAANVYKEYVQSKVVDILDLECHFKWSKNVKEKTHDMIKRRVLNAVEGLELFKTRRDLEIEMFPAKFLSLKCFEVMSLTYASEEEDATEIIKKIKENFSTIFDYKNKKYGHDLNGVYYLLDSMELNIKYLQNNETCKMVNVYRTFDELAPRAKPTGIIVDLAKQIVDLDPEFKEWQITYCKALRNHRLNVFVGPHMERTILIPSQEELNCLKNVGFNDEYDPADYDENINNIPGYVLMRLTLCDILSDYLRSGSSNQLTIGNTLVFKDRDEIIEKIVTEIGDFDYFYPNSIRIKLKVAEIFRQSYLRSSERNVVIYEDALDKLLDIYPRHPKFYKEKAVQVISNRLHNRETALNFLEAGMDLEPLNQHSLLSYLKFLVGFGNLNFDNVDILNKKLELAESEGWSIDFKTTIIFFRGCLYWIDNEKLTALQDWIYGYNIAQCSAGATLNSNENGNVIKNSFLGKFWYMTKTQIKKNDWPAGIIGWKEVLEYLATKPLNPLNESELKVISEIKRELEDIRDENIRQRQLQNYPDPPNLDKYKENSEQ